MAGNAVSDKRLLGEVHDHTDDVAAEEALRPKFAGELGIFDEEVDVARELAASHGITMETCVTDEVHPQSGRVLGKKVWSGDASNYPKHGQTVRVHYEGWIKKCPMEPDKEGVLFDSSRARERTFEFMLGHNQVIQGWEETIQLMSRGQRSMVSIPPEMAYDIKGYPPLVPSNATLLYDIELISFSDLGTDGVDHSGEAVA